MKLLFIDIETTGLNPETYGIHQISGMVVINGESKEEFNYKVQPHSGDLINMEALAVSGITRDDLKQYPPVMEVYNSFTNLLSKYVSKFDKQDKFFLVGYNNASFDTPFLRRWFEKCGDKYFGSWFWSHSLDVIVLAGEYLKNERHLMDNFKLKSVADRCGIEVHEERLHDAIYDIHLTKAVYDCVTAKPVS